MQKKKLDRVRTHAADPRSGCPAAAAAEEMLRNVSSEGNRCSCGPGQARVEGARAGRPMSAAPWRAAAATSRPAGAGSDGKMYHVPVRKVPLGSGRGPMKPPLFHREEGVRENAVFRWRTVRPLRRRHFSRFRTGYPESGASDNFRRDTYPP